MRWNTFLAISSDTTSKSSAKSGLSSAHSNNNSSGKRAGCCCRQEGEAQRGSALGLQRTGQARAARRGRASALSKLPAPPVRPDPCPARCPSRPLRPCAVFQGRLPLCQSLGGREGAVTEAQHRTGGAEVQLHIAAGTSSGPESSACLQATAPAESSLIYTQIIYSKSAFLTHAFILLYCNVST